MRRVDPRGVAKRHTAPVFAATLLVSAIVLLGGPRVASACKCAPPPPPREAMNEAHAVFEGKLVGQAAMTRVLQDGGGDPTQRVEVPIHVATFEILAVWKGDGLKVGDTVEIETSASSASCGRDYTYATEWVIYANAHSSEGDTGAGASSGEGGKLRLGDMACTRSGPSDAANGDGDVAALDALAPRIGVATTEGAPPETKASREGCSVSSASGDLAGSAGLLAIALACLGLPLGRASRKSRR